MKTYKVYIAETEMILEGTEFNLECIQNRNCEYTELNDIPPTHSINDFMEFTLNQILKK